MKTESVDSLDAGVAALHNGAECALFCTPFHDNPPGDWYVQSDVVCQVEMVPKLLADGWRQYAGDGLYKGFPYFYQLSEMPGGLAGREVIRRFDEETPEFATGLQPQVESVRIRALAKLTTL